MAFSDAFPNFSAFLNRHMRVSIACCLACVLFTGMVIYHIMGGGSSGATKAYYTTDDGATWFVDSAALNPPIDHAGKEANRLHIFYYDGKRNPLYLERYYPDMKAALDNAKNDPVELRRLALPSAGGREVKSVSGGPWVAVRSGEGSKVTAIPSDDPDAHEVFP